MRSKLGVSEALSSIIIIAIAVIAGLSAAVYINSVSNYRMQEYGESTSNIINQNNEDIVIVHAKYENKPCKDNHLAVWIYNAGSIDTSITKAYLDDINLKIDTNLLPISTISILCLDISIERTQSNEYTLMLESKHGNRDSIKVSINE